MNENIGGETNQTVLDKKPVLKCRALITFLAVIALLCAAVNIATSFMSYSYWDLYNQGKLTEALLQHLTPVWEYVSPSYLDFSVMLLTFSTYALLAIYVFGLFKIQKGWVMVPIIFASVTAGPLLRVIDTYIKYYKDPFDSSSAFPIGLITIIAFTLATISALRGLSNKVLIIVPIVVNLAMCLSTVTNRLPQWMFWIKMGFTYMAVNEISGVAASVLLSVALLLLGLTNRIPAVFGKSAKQRKAEEKMMDLEQNLNTLKDMFDRGVLTEDEYLEQRDIILSSLSSRL